MASAYSVPAEAQRLFEEGILKNPLINRYIPASALSDGYRGHRIRFTGTSSPTAPIPWRLAEGAAALKAYEALMLNALLARKYGVAGSRVRVDTDHALLFIMAIFLWQLDPRADVPVDLLSMHGSADAVRRFERFFPSWDTHGATRSLYRTAATNIYKAKDGRYFHLHGSMNPDPILTALSMPPDTPAKDWASAHSPYAARIAQSTASELQAQLVDGLGQAGTPCYSADEYRASEHGRANAHVGLFELHHRPDARQPAGNWWPDAPHTSARRPLAGLKVVELTRVIAAPAVGRGLAEYGASVMRIVAPHQPDWSALHVELSQGKWQAVLDLRQEAEREKLRALIRDADVFIEGYRPYALDKYGFGAEDVLALCAERPRGIIYLRENCYGWQGPWSRYIGWQQISDANSGVSMGYGKAMGLDEPVTPIFPNSDFCTGLAGSIAVITALLEREEKGGSFIIDLALNYYSQWLINTVGTYPAGVWESLWARYDKHTVRHDQNMQESVGPFMALLKQKAGSTLFKPEFFCEWPAIARSDAEGMVKQMVRTVAPVLKFEGNDNGKEVTEPGFHVSVRTNGVDQARWPDDLSVDVVG